MKNNKLESALPNSLGKDLTDLGVNILEVGVDEVINEGVLKEIPIIGSAVGLIKSGVSIKDHFYVKKLMKFLDAFKDIDEESRVKFVSEELKDETKKEKFGETVLALIEKSDDTDKFKLYAKIFEICFSGHCKYDDAIKTCWMIENTFYSDLLYIKNFKDESFENQSIASNLYKGGFLDFCGFDSGEIGKENSGGIIYKINKHGDILKEIVF